MLILFSGEETYAPREAVRALTDKFLTKNPSGAGFSRLDCADGADLATVRSALFAQSLFTERRLVIVENPFALAAEDQRALADDLARIATEDVVVLWQQGNVRADSVLLKKATAVAHTHKDYQRLTGAKLTAWILAYAVGRGVTIEASAVATLLAYVPADCARLALAIDLLIASAEGGPVTATLVAAMLPRRPEADAFAAAAAAFAGDRTSALRLLHETLEAGEDPLRLMGLYAYNIRTFLAIADALARDARATPAAIAQTTGAKPFVVSRARALLHSGTLSLRRLLAAHDLLTTLDREVKTGVCDAPLALVRLVARM